MTIDCKISFNIGEFKKEDILSLINNIHTDFIKELLFTCSVLLDKNVKTIRVSDIDNFLYKVHTNREEIKDNFFHYIDFNDDKKMIYSVLNLLNTEESMYLDKQMRNDTKLIISNKTLKNLCKFIIQYLFKVDLHIKLSSDCGQGGQTICKGWFDYENCPLYAYSLTVFIIFAIVYSCIMLLKEDTVRYQYIQNNIE